MSGTPASPLTTEAAVRRARLMIASGQKLREAAKTVSRSRASDERHAAEQLKEARLLGYRASTIPDALEPVLEALIRAATDHTASN